MHMVVHRKLLTNSDNLKIISCHFYLTFWAIG